MATETTTSPKMRSSSTLNKQTRGFMAKATLTLFTLMFLLVFSHSLRGHVEVFPGVDYAAFLVPGLAMMSVQAAAAAIGRPRSE